MRDDLSLEGHPGGERRRRCRCRSVGPERARGPGRTPSCPQLAQVAIQSGRHAAEQILRRRDGLGTTAFPLSGQGPDGDDRTQSRRRPIDARGPVIRGLARVARLARAPPRLPDRFPQPPGRDGQLDLALLRLAIGTAADHRRVVAGPAPARPETGSRRWPIALPS